MLRRKGRTILTVTGITVGIFAFTVMGSMALRFNKMISGGKLYITGQITLMPKGTSFSTGSGGALLPLDVLQRIEKVEGVAAVAGGVELGLKEPDPDNPLGGASFDSPATIEGMDLQSSYKNRNWQTMAMKSGRMIEKGDPDSAIAVGYTIAADNKLKVGDTFTIRKRDFKVVGIIDQTLTGPRSVRVHAYYRGTGIAHRFQPFFEVAQRPGGRGWENYRC